MIDENSQFHSTTNSFQRTIQHNAYSLSVLYKNVNSVQPQYDTHVGTNTFMPVIRSVSQKLINVSNQNSRDGYSNLI